MGKEGTSMAAMPAAEISECEAATSEAAEDPSSLAHQDKLAQNKFKGVDKNPVAAFNRRDKMKRFDSADWMMEKSGKPGARPNLLQRATQGKLGKKKPPLPAELQAAQAEAAQEAEAPAAEAPAGP